jgi:hypothetical protein
MAQSANTITYSQGTVLTPSDTALFFFTALLVQGTGNVTIELPDGTSLLFTSVPAFTVLPIQGRRVKSSGTSATLIIGLN